MEKNISKDIQKDTQSNKYFCTVNNPEKYGYDYTTIAKICYEKFKTARYMCICTEISTTGTKHYHFFIYFTSRVRFSTIRKQFPHVDIRKARGTPSQCIAYVQKSGKWELDEKKQSTVVKNTFKEFGERPNDKKDNDSSELYRLIQDGYSNAEIFSENTEYIKQASIIDKIRFDIKSSEIEGKRRLNLEVYYIQGETGTWKTRTILDKYGDENVCRITNYKRHPFDAYKFHDVLCLEEFRDSLPMADMLNYLDIYSVNLPARYADKPLFATKIFIISNWPLEKQYRDEQVTDNESYQAFLRRIHKVMEFRKGEEPITYDSVNDYFRQKQLSIGFNLKKISDEDFERLMNGK